ncbi:hypothetical protein tb265_10420 [Gemmatimonadetes bacterium T265]|nr:hypothetical protein tb265_10420 [Gemmatimonadetes bacterium T265]
MAGGRLASGSAPRGDGQGWHERGKESDGSRARAARPHGSSLTRCPHTPNAPMAIDPKFFKEGETEFSVFYPRGYVLAAFPERATADAAVAALRTAGFAGDDVGVIDGADAIARHEDYQDQRTVGDRVRQFFAGLYGDESALLDHLLDLAQRGDAMVLAFAPDDAATTRAASVLKPLGPEVLVKYGTLAVTDLR